MTKKAFPWFLSLTAFFFLSRFLLILWGIESVWHYEELEQGYIAIEFLSGLRAPLMNYQADPYTGGTLLTGLMAIPFFNLFGPTLFSLKLLALTLSFGSFSLMYALMKYCGGRKTAVTAALLWIFAAPLLTRTSLMALGSHERMLPGLAILFFLLQAVTREKNKTLWFSGLALACGLAISISYINLIAILAAGITLISAKKTPEKVSEFILPVIAFTAGLCVWLGYNLSHDWAGVQFLLGASSTDIMDSPAGYAKYLIKELYRFLIYFWPNSLSFPSLLYQPGKVFSYGYFLVLAGFIFRDWLTDFRSGKTASGPAGILKRFCRIYLILFPLFHCVSRYKVYTVEFNPFHYRYFIPLYTFSLLYFSAVLAGKKSHRPVLALLICLGLMSQFQAVYGKPFGTVFTQPGFKSGLRYYIWWHPPFPKFKNPGEFEREALRRLSEPPSQETTRFFIKVANQENFWTLGSPDQISKTVSKIPRNTLRRYFFRRWGAQLDVEYNLKDLKLVSSVGNTVPERYRRDFYLGAAKQLNFAAWADIQNVQTFIEDPSVPFKEIFYLAWGASLFRLVRNGYESEARFRKQMDFVNNLEETKRIWVYRGLGIPIYRSFQAEQILALNMDFLDKFIPQDFLREPYWGVGWYLARRYFRYPRTAIEKIRQLKPEQKVKACEGFRTFHQEDPEMLAVAGESC